MANSMAGPSDGNLRIPATVRIGVSGHRELRDEPLLRGRMERVLAKLDRLLRHTPHTFIAVSPLAEGADRLVANVILSWPVAEGQHEPSLDVVLPLPKPDYLLDFETHESRKAFETLLGRAQNVRTLPSVQSRRAAYEQVGHWVVHNCDVLIAIWDGKPAAGKGGTAEIVDYAEKVGRTTYWIHAETGKLCERRSDDGTLDSLSHLDAYNAEPPGTREIRVLSDANYAFLMENATGANDQPDEAKPKLTPEEAEALLGPLREHLLPQYVRADCLAQVYNDRHGRAGSAVYALAASAVAVVGVQVLFVPHLPQLLWGEVLAMAAALLLLGAAHVAQWHRKWIDYRFLAERLRAAIFLCVAGVDCQPVPPPPLPSFSHKPNEWMVTAFTWMWSGHAHLRPCVPTNLEGLKGFLLDAWLLSQRNWFFGKLKRHRRRYAILARGGEAVFGLTLLAALLHATGWGELLMPEFTSTPFVLAFLAIVLPAVGTALAGIRMHREYQRNADRYAQMVHVLTALADQIHRTSDHNTLGDLLRETNDVMLRENLAWRADFRFRNLHAP